MVARGIVEMDVKRAEEDASSYVGVVYRRLPFLYSLEQCFPPQIAS